MCSDATHFSASWPCLVSLTQHSLGCLLLTAFCPSGNIHMPLSHGGLKTCIRSNSNIPHVLLPNPTRLSLIRKEKKKKKENGFLSIPLVKLMTQGLGLANLGSPPLQFSCSQLPDSWDRSPLQWCASGVGCVPAFGGAWPWVHSWSCLGCCCLSAVCNECCAGGCLTWEGVAVGGLFLVPGAWLQHRSWWWERVGSCQLCVGPFL